MKLSSFFTIILILAGFHSARSQTTLATANTSFTETQYQNCINNAGKLLEEVFVLLRKNYINKDAVDWDHLSLEARKKLESSTSCQDAYNALNWCFLQMKEPHSFAMPAIKAAEYNNDTSFLRFKPDLSALVGEIKSELMDSTTAYLTIPRISSSDESISSYLADSLQRLIQAYDKVVVSSWVIDLRENTGGNCWPMLAGVGPLLGEGVCGYFIRNEERVPIIYKNGASWEGKNLRTKVVGNGYQMQTPIRKLWFLPDLVPAARGKLWPWLSKGFPTCN